MLTVMVPAQLLWEFLSAVARPWNGLGPWIVAWGRASFATAAWVVFLGVAALAVVSIAAFLVWLIEPTLERAPWLRHRHAGGVQAARARS